MKPPPIRFGVRLTPERDLANPVKTVPGSSLLAQEITLGAD